MRNLSLAVMVVWLGTMPVSELALAVRKFVYQQDLSEHCRRRVIPSMFVGRKVTEAQAQILHLSQLEMPYSCYITIRTELGSNVVMVVQLPTDEDLEATCAVYENQLLVYDLGETFGGYWGPVPAQSTPIRPTLQRKYYTLRTTTERPYEKKSPSTETKRRSTRKLRDEDTDSTSSDHDFIEFEIPLVNVSGGRLVESDDVAPQSFTQEDMFDIIYDVKPNPDESGEVHEVPILNLSISDPMDDNKFSVHKMKGNDRPTKNPFLQDLMTMQYTHTVQKQLFETLYLTKAKPKAMRTNRYTHPWERVQSIMTDYQKENPNIYKATTSNTKIPSVLKMLSDQKINTSAFLLSEQDLLKQVAAKPPTLDDKRKLQYSTGNDRLLNREETHATLTNRNPYTKSYKKEKEEHKKPVTRKLSGTLITQDRKDETARRFDTPLPQSKTNKEPKAMSSDNLEKGVNWQSIDSASASPQKAEMGSLVDHESWENVVQVAPALIQRLNHSAQKRPSNSSIGQSSRDKRFIRIIPIQHARPHNLTTAHPQQMTIGNYYKLRNMVDFARLVEIQDDEIYGHVIMKTFNNYVGSVLYNICDHTDSTRHIVLLNSSRILLAIKKFTMKRMTVVATPATTLSNPSSRCTKSYIECQVSGSRICVDLSTACDGVPNCGAYDIYDEDRLMCGAMMQHSIYLATFTFIAVVLTLLYIVHYWLKQCVPKVSDAFFVYTNGSENVLCLNTVMRSPAADTELTKSTSRVSMSLAETVEEVPKPGPVWKMRNFFAGLLGKKEPVVLQTDLHTGSNFYDSSKWSSFMEMELSKMGQGPTYLDKSIQTGDSLEMNKGVNAHKTPFELANSEKTRQSPQDILSAKEGKKTEIPHDDFPNMKEEFFTRVKAKDSELNLIKFVNGAKTVTSQLDEPPKEKVIKATHKRGSVDIGIGEERFLQCTELDRSSTEAGPSNRYGMVSAATSTKKHLRFDEKPITLIENEKVVEDPAGEDSKEEKKRYAMLVGHGKSLTKNVQEEDHQEHGMTGRDIMRLWGKKKKKSINK